MVVIEADGPLPLPRVGVLGDPPRIYLDFAGVTAGTPGTALQAEGLVRRVRVGRYQPDPPITRVVLDLAQVAPHRLDARERERGLVKVMVGPALAQAAAERDGAVVLDALGQLERLRPLLAAIDSRTDMPEVSLRAAIGEFDAIRRTLAPIRSGGAQEALMKVCALATAAATARIEAQQHADPARAWNAASAAAGALILLDRARSLLKPAPAQKH